MDSWLLDRVDLFSDQVTKGLLVLVRMSLDKRLQTSLDSVLNDKVGRQLEVTYLDFSNLIFLL